MVSSNESAHGTAFTLSIEAAEGVTTGISAYDRALTIRTAVAPNAKPEDLVQPGHIFPLMAQPGGVLTRAGHTEAGCDLTRLAGMEPAAVIVEILNEDGTMARRGDLETFASRHGLKMGTIADLIRYRLVNEQTVERMAECSLQTDFGEFRLIAFEDTMHRLLHFALVKGDPGSADAPLVRVQLPDTLRDLLSGRIDDGSRPLRSAMERVAREPCGIVVILAHEEPADELVRRIRMLGMEQDAHRSPVAGGASGSDLRTYGVGAQILRDLGVQRMRVVGAPRRLHGISGFGLDVVDYVD
jgi:3,4-dihydroxy 2-butanone 4-phosphate synthase/GTP cyclohydrolase II